MSETEEKEPEIPAVEDAAEKPIVESIPFVVREIIPLRKVVDDYIQWSLAVVAGNKPEAATKLNISLKTIYNRMKVW